MLKALVAWWCKNRPQDCCSVRQAVIPAWLLESLVFLHLMQLIDDRLRGEVMRGNAGDIQHWLQVRNWFWGWWTRERKWT